MSEALSEAPSAPGTKEIGVEFVRAGNNLDNQINFRPSIEYRRWLVDVVIGYIGWKFAW